MNSTSDGPGNNTPAGGSQNRENRDNRNPERRNRANQRHPTSTKFEGKNPDLKGFVYDIRLGGTNAEEFATTTKEISEWIARTYEDGGADIGNAIDPDKLEFDPFPAITDPPAAATMVQIKTWEFQMKQRFHEEFKRTQLSKLAYATVLGQCSQAVRDRIEASNTWASISSTNDVIGLLKLLRISLFSGATSRHVIHSIQEAQERFHAFRQSKHMSDADYLARFKNLHDAMVSLGGDVGTVAMPPRTYLLHAIDPDNPTPDELDTARLQVREEYLGIKFVRHADPSRYYSMMADMKNNFTAGINKYPKTLTEAHKLLVNYDDPHNKKKSPHDAETNNSGVSFYQEENGGRGRGAGTSSGGGRGGGGRGSGGRGRGGGGTSGNDRNEPSDSSNPSANSPNDTNNNTTEPYPASPILETRSHVLNQTHENIPATWILIDSCSSVDIIASRELLRDIHIAHPPMRLHCNAGSVTLTEQGYFGDYPVPVWYHPTGVANILSLRNVTQHFRVTMDSHRSNCITLHKHDGTVYKFYPSDTGLYRMAFRTPQAAIQMWSFVTTVKDQANNYTRRDLERAQDARQMQNIIMHPSDHILAKNAIRYLANCPVTEHDVRVANDIFGANLGSLKGKTVHRPNPHVQAGIAPVPPDILSRHRDVTLAIDIMFVNKIPFLVTVSRALKFVTVEDLLNRKVTTVRDKLRAVLRLYRHRGFHVTTLLGDQEFEPLREFFPFINTCGADEHVPDVERMIRTIKDRARSAHSLLPFRSLPRLIVVRLIGNAVLWLNAFPNANGVSTVHSPRFILTGRDLTYDKHVRLPFGAYVQTHEEHTNDLRHRTLGAICLGPTGNAQGGHFFMSLTSGARIIRHRWTPLPMPSDAIQRVTQMGRAQHMPSTVTFADRHGHEIADPILHDLDHYSYGSDDDSTYSSHDESSASSSDSYDTDEFDDDPSDDDADAAPDAPSDDNGADNFDLFPNSDPDSDDASSSSALSSASSSSLSAAHTPPALAPLAAITPGDAHSDDNDSESSVESTGVESPPYPDDDPSVDTSATAETVETPGVINSPVETPGVPNLTAETPGVQQQLDNPGAPGDTTYDLFRRAEEHGRRAALGQATPGRPQRESRSTKTNEYTYLTSLLDTIDPDRDHRLFSLVTEQMTAQRGLKEFGQRGTTAIEKELQQLLSRRVMHGVHAHAISRQQRGAALRYLMFLKEKRSGDVKGRGCADGRKQRLYKTKEETSSPTVSTEALLLTCVVDAIEARCVLICDIPGAFMQADIDEIVHLRLDGPILSALLRIAPSYQQFVTYEKGKPVLYTELDKALYGTLQAALLFWERLSKFLTNRLGFIINPYDECVANKAINGKQCTIAWYVDDLKISHEDEDVIEEVFRDIESEFGKEAPLTVSRGKIHNYLGMQIDYSTRGQVKITMPHMIEEILKQLPKSLSQGPATTPAANHLFQVSTSAEKLDKENAELFHRLTAQLLYLSKRARPDLQTAVSFFTTRVTSPDQDDFKKLGRCIRYLRRTAHYPLTLEASSLSYINWWVDASYGVHPDLRSHTGGTMMVGKGSVYSSSIRQKINTRSSTEAELVGVNDMMGLILWTRNFIEAQGYEVHENTVYQDNESAILLEKNGRRSSSKRTRHLEVRYFFVTDNVKRKRISISYCPTGDMVADFFTKPLQGSTFRKLLKMVMNLDDAVIDQPPQECVGKPETEDVQTGGQTVIGQPATYVPEYEVASESRATR